VLQCAGRYIIGKRPLSNCIVHRSPPHLRRTCARQHTIVRRHSTTRVRTVVNSWFWRHLHASETEIRSEPFGAQASAERSPAAATPKVGYLTLTVHRRLLRHPAWASHTWGHSGRCTNESPHHPHLGDFIWQWIPDAGCCRGRANRLAPLPQRGQALGFVPLVQTTSGSRSRRQRSPVSGGAVERVA